MPIDEAVALAEAELAKWGLDEAGWSVVVRGLKSAAGYCDYDKKIIALSREITALCADEDVVDTVMHEVAHALTPGAKHGPEWKKMAKRLGAQPVAHSKDLPVVPHKWLGVCAGGHEFRRHRRISGTCGDCQTLVVWKAVI